MHEELSSALSDDIEGGVGVDGQEGICAYIFTCCSAETNTTYKAIILQFQERKAYFFEFIPLPDFPTVLFSL